MVTFQVNDMTCARCVSAITKALKAADKDAKVQIDLRTHRVHVEAASAQAGTLAEAVKDTGYSPVTASQPQAASAHPGKAGGCCGCCR